MFYARTLMLDAIGVLRNNRAREMRRPKGSRTTREGGWSIYVHSMECTYKARPLVQKLVRHARMERHDVELIILD